MESALAQSITVNGRLQAIGLVAQPMAAKVRRRVQSGISTYDLKQMDAAIRDRAFAFRPFQSNTITTVGKNFVVDSWQNLVELEIMKYHGVGTGTNASNAADTTLQTESTTALNPDSTRATGTLAEGASANIFRTVGTPVFDNSAAITEWGLFSQAATGGGTMFSHVVFAAINVVATNSIQFTYEVTVG